MDRKEYQNQRRQSRKKTHIRVELELTLEENAYFQGLAKQAKMRKNLLIKQRALNSENTNPQAIQDLQESVNQLSLLIRNIGNNLNQLSHSANIFREVDRDLVFQHLQQLDKTVADFVDEKIK